MRSNYTLGYHFCFVIKQDVYTDETRCKNIFMHHYSLLRQVRYIDDQNGHCIEYNCMNGLSKFNIIHKISVYYRK